MLKKAAISAVFLFSGCFFCNVYSQEAVIMLESQEQIEQFQKMLAGEEDVQIASGSAGGMTGIQEESIVSENKFEVFIPQAKDDEGGSGGEKRNIKWLESSEDLKEFEELLKKAQFEPDADK